MDIRQVTETIAMIEEQNFDIRTITMGISLLDCIDSDIERAADKVYKKITTKAKDLVAVGNEIAQEALAKHITEINDGLNAKMLDLATRVRENMALSRIMLIDAKDNEYIATYVHSDKKTAVAVVLNSDRKEAFGNEEIKQFAFDCCLHVAAFLPPYIKEENVDPAYIAEQTEIFKGQVAELDKPEKVKEGIVQGKLKKHLSEVCFLDQMFVKDDKMSVKAKLAEISKKAGCTLDFSNVVLWQLGIKK